MIAILEKIELFHRSKEKYVIEYKREFRIENNFLFNWRLQQLIDFVESSYRPKHTYSLEEFIQYGGNEYEKR